jgi:hypothetical protein
MYLSIPICDLKQGSTTLLFAFGASNCLRLILTVLSAGEQRFSEKKGPQTLGTHWWHEESSILGATVHNLVAMATWHSEFVYL